MSIPLPGPTDKQKKAKDAFKKLREKAKKKVPPTTPPKGGGS